MIESRRRAAAARTLAIVIGLGWAMIAAFGPARPAMAQEGLASELKKTGYRIVYETYQDGNWELFMAAMDGSPPANLTRTPKVHELYPKLSPDGSKIAFLVDEGQGESTVRSVYLMNFDGTQRTLVARGARWPCWSPDGKAIAYLKQEGDRFAYNDPYTKGLWVYDLASGTHREHPNKEIHHIYNPCWSADGEWFLATVSGGMGYQHTNLAIEARGSRVVDLGLPGCRPDISPDGKRVAWGASDWTMRVGDLDWSGPEPKVTQRARRGDLAQAGSDLPHGLVARREVRRLQPGRGQEAAGNAPGHRRHPGRGLEHLRSRRFAQGPLGADHHRRPFQQGARLGARPAQRALKSAGFTPTASPLLGTPSTASMAGS